MSKKSCNIVYVWNQYSKFQIKVILYNIYVNDAKISNRSVKTFIRKNTKFMIAISLYRKEGKWE